MNVDEQDVRITAAERLRNKKNKTYPSTQQFNSINDANRSDSQAVEYKKEYENVKNDSNYQKQRASNKAAATRATDTKNTAKNYPLPNLDSKKTINPVAQKKQNQFASNKDWVK